MPSMNDTGALAALSLYREAIDAEVKRLFAARDSRMERMLRSQLGFDEDLPDSGPNMGKGLRPSLTLLVCEAMGGEVEQALPVAVAIEMVHNFSLVHDDIEDNDDMRHHRPTLWRVFGREQAIAGGIGLWSKAYAILMSAASEALPAATVLEARSILNDACQTMIEGQHLDLSYEGRSEVSLDEYIEMIADKTAALLSASIQIGALLAGAGATEVTKLGEFGRQMGLAFQIRDDILGIWGEDAATGKPVGSDIARKKKSLPIVHALQQAAGADLERLRAVYSQDDVSDADVSDVLAILQRLDSYAASQALAESYRDQALAILAGAGIAPSARERLESLTRFVSHRDY